MDHELILAQLEEDSMVARAGIEPTANCLEGSCNQVQFISKTLKMWQKCGICCLHYGILRYIVAA